LNNLDYWQNRLKARNAGSPNQERDGVIRAITFALDIQEVWPQTYKLILGFSPRIERQGLWEAWARALKKAIASARQIEDATAETELTLLLTRLRFQQGRFKETVSGYR